MWPATLATTLPSILVGVSSATDTPAGNTSNVLVVQGVGSTAFMKGTGLNATPVAFFPGAKITIGDTGLPTVTSGSGAPGATEPNGSIYLRTDGGASTRLYVSAGGGTWAPIASV